MAQAILLAYLLDLADQKWQVLPKTEKKQKKTKKKL
jgi:hypothetical protein